MRNYTDDFICGRKWGVCMILNRGNGMARTNEPSPPAGSGAVAVPLRARRAQRLSASRAQTVVVMAAKGSGPLRVIISGAPASGKGTQCETIVKEVRPPLLSVGATTLSSARQEDTATYLQFGLTHISAGDLLRAEVAAGTEAGKTAKAHMEKGELVPDQIVTTMVKSRLSQQDAQAHGWLLDGYPR